MKKLLSILLAMLMLLSCTAFAETADNIVYVSISDDTGALVLAYVPVAVSDADGDGALTICDALVCAHTMYHPDGAAAFVAEDTEWGKSLYVLWGIDNGGAVVATLIAFVINYAAYFSEIFRGGIESIPKGQYEAGQVLGMTKAQIFRKVVLMQVVKRILPPISNEVITLVKDTALARVIGVIEIIKRADMYTSKAIIWPLFYAGAFYLVFVGLLTILFNYLEKKLSYYKV